MKSSKEPTAMKSRITNHTYNMANFQLEEAIARARANGIKVKKKDIAERLWPTRTQEAQQVNMSALCNGRRKTINPDWVEVICDMCNCTPNELFGYEKI